MTFSFCTNCFSLDESSIPCRKFFSTSSGRILGGTAKNYRSRDKVKLGRGLSRSSSWANSRIHYCRLECRGSNLVSGEAGTAAVIRPDVSINYS